MSRIRPTVALLIAASLGAPDAHAKGTLAKAIAQALAHRPPPGASIGVHVVELTTGRTVYDRNADRRFNPASGVKLVTTAAALDAFGPAHTFTTRVVTQAPPAGGVVQGDLVLRAGGDPALMTRDLWRLAHLVKAHGIQEVRGDIVLDASRFDGVKVPPKFDKKDSDHAYRAYVGAGASDYGTLQVRVRPGPRPGDAVHVVVDPPGAKILLDNKGTTKAGRSRLVVGTVPQPSRDKVVIRGTLPPDGKLRTILRRTDFPNDTAIRAFMALLQGEGVTIGGGARVSTTAPTPPANFELGRHPSHPLDHLVARVNQWSNNFMAEMLLKNIGAKHLGGRGGSSAAGSEAVGRFLTSLGVPKAAFSYGNGSGLYDANEFTPRALTTVLAAMWKRPDISHEYVSSLAVAGRPGTLQSRLTRPRSMSGRIRAKTGTLSGAISLSGYAMPSGGGVYAFSILMNNLRGVSVGRFTADRVVTTLANWTEPPRPVKRPSTPPSPSDAPAKTP